MIKFLAQLFRGLHFIVGISAPPPGTSERKFVFAWLGGIAVIVAFGMIRSTSPPFCTSGIEGLNVSSNKQTNYRQGGSSLG